MKTSSFSPSSVWKNYCQRNKRMALALAFPLAFTGCDNDNRIKEAVLRMQAVAVEIPSEKMLCIGGMGDSLNSEEGKEMPFRLVAYTDSNRCTSCVLNGLSEWNALLNLERERKVRLVFILHPRKEELEKAIHSYYHSGLEHPVWIDTCGIFLNDNPHIPDGSMFHTFLLDKDGNIVLVGNPLTNNRIREIFDSLTTDEGISDI